MFWQFLIQDNWFDIFTIYHDQKVIHTCIVKDENSEKVLIYFVVLA